MNEGSEHTERAHLPPVAATAHLLLGEVRPTEMSELCVCSLVAHGDYCSPASGRGEAEGDE